jgi:hypothetical protein
MRYVKRNRIALSCLEQRAWIGSHGCTVRRGTCWSRCAQNWTSFGDSGQTSIGTIVLEGRFDFEAAGERHSLGPGEMLVIPRGAAHGFACTSPDAGRLLTISTPARVFEAFVADISAANADPAADARAVFARHGFDLL